MTKNEKLIEKWKNYLAPEVPRKDVEKVARTYGFNIESSSSGGSHMIYSHVKLIGEPGYSEIGGFTVPYVSGKTVKKIYVKNLLKAIEIIENEEGNDEKE
ncbi:MAG TPA: type II toxin-antitoxin system HicA family toxin [Clostridiales bacterium]|nr:type II toxin-antitoxin system HicA family toxin [Clostridiales bacterium]